MIDQIASRCGIATLFYRPDEIGFVGKQTINRLLNHLGGIFAPLIGGLAEASLGFG